MTNTQNCIRICYKPQWNDIGLKDIITLEQIFSFLKNFCFIWLLTKRARWNESSLQ